jgi:hypothetical protein
MDMLPLSGVRDDRHWKYTFHCEKCGHMVMARDNSLPYTKAFVLLCDGQRAYRAMKEFWNWYCQNL